MAKTLFNEHETRILNILIRPGKDKPLANAARQCLAHRVAGDLKLKPLLIEKEGDYLQFMESDFDIDPRRLKDGDLNYFYLPTMCQEATGSKESNWREWSNAALNYGRLTHDLAPYMPLHEDIQDDLVAREFLNPHGASRPVRLLSIEMVAFYILAQTGTWKNPAEIRSTKKWLANILGDESLAIPVDPSLLLSDEEEVDLDSMLTKEDNVNIDKIRENSTLANTRYPKKAQPALGYNPTQALAEQEAVSVVSSNRDGEIVITEDMSLDEIQLAMASLAALARQKREEAARMAAHNFEVSVQDVDLSKGIPTRLLVRMSTGEELTFNLKPQPNDDVDDLLNSLEC